MKTFIFLFILIAAFFFYLFSSSEDSQTIKSVNTPIETLEALEIDGTTVNEVKTVDQYFSNDLQRPTAIPEDQTFETVKNILHIASDRAYTPVITLNTQINSYLYTGESKEKFKQELSKTFNVSYDDIDTMYQKNTLVWDWVNQFKE